MLNQVVSKSLTRPAPRKISPESVQFSVAKSVKLSVAMDIGSAYALSSSTGCHSSPLNRLVQLTQVRTVSGAVHSA